MIISMLSQLMAWSRKKCLIVLRSSRIQLCKSNIKLANKYNNTKCMTADTYDKYLPIWMKLDVRNFYLLSKCPNHIWKVSENDQVQDHES